MEANNRIGLYKELLKDLEAITLKLGFIKNRKAKEVNWDKDKSTLL